MKDRTRTRREHGGHEAQLHEGPHADREQEIHDLVGVEEGVQRLLVLAHKGSHVVIENAVKAHVPEPEFPMRARKLRLPVRAQGERGVAAADGVFPEVRQRLRRLTQVAVENGAALLMLRWHGR